MRGHIQNKPRTIFIVYFDLGIGGVQRKIVDIVNYLDQTNRNIRIYILLENQTKKSLATQIYNPNVIIRHKPFSRMPYWTFILWYMLWKNPISILSFLTLPSLYAEKARKVLFWRKTRLIISQDVVTSDAFTRKDFTREENKIVSRVFSRADAVIVPAQIIADDLVHHYNMLKGAIHHIPNWTTLSGVAATKEKTIDCIYIGRIDKEKRHDRMLSIIAKIKKTVPNISLSIVGEGKELFRVKEAIRRKKLGKNIFVHSPTTEIQSYLQRAKIAVCTSQSEGAPMFILEAMALGLPVVTSSYPGADQLVIHNGSGFVCATQDQFVTSVRKLLLDGSLRQSMGKYGKNLIKKQYSPKNMNMYINYLFSFGKNSHE